MLTTIQKPEVRKAAYGVVAAVMTLLTVLGIVKADAAAQYLDSISQVAGVVFLLIARYFVPSPEEKASAVTQDGELERPTVIDPVRYGAGNGPEKA
nr:MAG TPA: Mycobacterial 2 TMS Phage Holin (M2 Hol) Family [Caudoviricetes sp.]